MNVVRENIQLIKVAPASSSNVARRSKARYFRPDNERYPERNRSPYDDDRRDLPRDSARDLARDLARDPPRDTYDDRYDDRLEKYILLCP